MKISIDGGPTMRGQASRKYAACALLFLMLLPLSSACMRRTANQEKPKMIRMDEVSNFVVLSIDKGKPITIQLYPEYAPITVANFQKLVRQGFYNNLTFFRSIKDFVVQAGDPKNDGTGGPGWTIKGEFKENGVNNPIHHTRGIVSMGRLASDNDSAGSQFFIVTSDKNSDSLDGNYAAFGMVIDGMDEVDRIAALQTNNDIIIDKPKIIDSYFVRYPDAQ